MNVIAAAPGWRNLAVWAMPPVACALASDTLIGVVRSWVIARHKHLNAALAAGEVTPLSVLGGLLRTGRLRGIKIGKLRRITEEQLAEFIASLEDGDAA